ncbi:MAG: hypothetical protein ACOX69_11545, partial [Coriobacteriales bacterium]
MKKRMSGKNVSQKTPWYLLKGAKSQSRPSTRQVIPVPRPAKTAILISVDFEGIATTSHLNYVSARIHGHSSGHSKGALSGFSSIAPIAKANCDIARRSVTVSRHPVLHGTTDKILDSLGGSGKGADMYTRREKEAILAQFHA